MTIILKQNESKKESEQQSTEINMWKSLCVRGRKNSLRLICGTEREYPFRRRRCVCVHVTCASATFLINKISQSCKYRKKHHPHRAPHTNKNMLWKQHLQYFGEFHDCTISTHRTLITLQISRTCRPNRLTHMKLIAIFNNRLANISMRIAAIVSNF